MKSNSLLRNIIKIHIKMNSVLLSVSPLISFGFTILHSFLFIMAIRSSFFSFAYNYDVKQHSLLNYNCFSCSLSGFFIASSPNSIFISVSLYALLWSFILRSFFCLFSWLIYYTYYCCILIQLLFYNTILLSGRLFSNCIIICFLSF